jgi:hypothetical protein
MAMKLEDLKKYYSMDQVENLYRQGYVTQEDYETYCTAWHASREVLQRPEEEEV